MSRPKKNRSVLKPPMFSEFKPVGVPSRVLVQTYLTLDEYEAFRLADHLGFGHEEASTEMNISRLGKLIGVLNPKLKCHWTCIFTSGILRVKKSTRDLSLILRNGSTNPGRLLRS